MSEPAPVVFLLDVDNTLLAYCRITDGLRRQLTQPSRANRQERDWAPFEQLRTELGYADDLGALPRYRSENPRVPHILDLSQAIGISQQSGHRASPRCDMVSLRGQHWLG